MKKEKNEIIPISPVIDITPVDAYTLEITGTIYPIIIDDGENNMISLIKFNKEYYQSIVDGIKTQTLRNKNKRLNEDEIVKAIFPGTDLEVILRITKTGYKQFKYLDEEDAELEGYNSLGELKKDLQEIYPSLDAFDRLYYYRFEVVGYDV